MQEIIEDEDEDVVVTAELLLDCNKHLVFDILSYRFIEDKFVQFEISEDEVRYFNLDNVKELRIRRE